MLFKCSGNRIIGNAFLIFYAPFLEGTAFYQSECV